MSPSKNAINYCLIRYYNFLSEKLANILINDNNNVKKPLKLIIV